MGHWSVLCPNNLPLHLHRSCMRANKRLSSALDRRHQDEADTTHTSKTEPRALFSILSVSGKSGAKGRLDGQGGCFVCGSVYSGRRLLMWFTRLRHGVKKVKARLTPYGNKNITPRHPKLFHPSS